MPQLTLVAHYGPKNRLQQVAFMTYVHACQQTVSRSVLGERFAPYQDAQIHGTLIGLEEVTGLPDTDPPTHYNANLWHGRGELRAMDLECALRLARSLPPMTIRFGGFQPQDRGIESRGHSAYARSFGIDWRTGKVVIIGWVVSAQYAGAQKSDFWQKSDFFREDDDLHGYTKLWAIRRTFAERCGMHHKYEDDSDFFVTIGELTGLAGLDEPILTELRDAGEEAAEALRKQLADPRRAIDLPLRAEDLSVVRYMDESLDPAGSLAFPITDPDLDVAALWRSLYV